VLTLSTRSAAPCGGRRGPVAGPQRQAPAARIRPL